MSNFNYVVEDYSLFCTSKNLSPKTITNYTRTLRLFTKYLEDELDIKTFEEVETRDIRRYINYLQERGKYTVAISNENINKPQNRNDLGKKLSTYTINNYLRNVKVFFNFMVEEKYISENPTERVKYLKQEDKIKEAITRDELKRILGEFDVFSLHGYRDYIITKLLVSTGSRIGETLSLTDGDIDFRNGVIVFKDTKNKKEKLGYLTNKMSFELKRWINFREKNLEYHSDYLFPTSRGSQLQVSSFGGQLKNASNRAGIEDVHPHRLRATFAIEYLNNGGSLHVLSRLLDHADISTTMIYLNISDKELRKEFLKYHPRVEI